jgi:hypothetical protein
MSRMSNISSTSDTLKWKSCSDVQKLFSVIGSDGGNITKKIKKKKNTKHSTIGQEPVKRLLFPPAPFIHSTH